MTADVKSRPSWRLSCHTYSYPECQLGRLVFGRPGEWFMPSCLTRSSCQKIKLAIVPPGPIF